MKYLAMATLCLMAGQSTALADCVKDNMGWLYCGPGQCVRANFGKVQCATQPGGGAVKEPRGNVLCGQGQCALDSMNTVRCAPTPGGSATPQGSWIICRGPDGRRVNCVSGAQSQCQAGKRAQ